MALNGEAHSISFPAYIQNYITATIVGRKSFLTTISIRFYLVDLQVLGIGFKKSLFIYFYNLGKQQALYKTISSAYVHLIQTSSWLSYE